MRLWRALREQCRPYRGVATSVKRFTIPFHRGNPPDTELRPTAARSAPRVVDELIFASPIRARSTVCCRASRRRKAVESPLVASSASRATRSRTSTSTGTRPRCGAGRLLDPKGLPVADDTARKVADNACQQRADDRWAASAGNRQQFASLRGRHRGRVIGVVLSWPWNFGAVLVLVASNYPPYAAEAVPRRRAGTDQCCPTSRFGPT